MRAFDDLVRSGKILYAGLSNFPAVLAVAKEIGASPTEVAIAWLLHKAAN